MNIAVTAVIVVTAAAFLSAVGFLLVSRFIPERFLVADTEAASALYATIGMVYAILIAIAAIAVWEPRTAASASTEQEASSLTEAYWAANSLTPDDKTQIQSLITGYLEEASTREWATLRLSQHGTPEGDQLFRDLREQIDAVDTSTERTLAAQQLLAGHVSQAAVARQSRLGLATEGMPGLLWWVLILGGLISVLFLYLFGLERTFPNGLMMAVVGGMIALLLQVIYEVEFPFSRSFAVGPEALRDALSHLGST